MAAKKSKGKAASAGRPSENASVRIYGPYAGGGAKSYRVLLPGEDGAPGGISRWYGSVDELNAFLKSYYGVK